MSAFQREIVFGTGFGDEGKGITTDYFANKYVKLGLDPIVIRFSGGQQCGHNVVLPDGRSHIFSSFGSGTLRGCRTYIAETCTIDPICIINEANVLIEKGFKPRLIIDPYARVTTPYEVYANQNDAENIENGSCGKGIWATIKRELAGYSIWAMDFKYPDILAAKMENLSKWYGIRLQLDRFYECCELIRNHYEIRILSDENDELESPIIMEGSQGLLLDQTHGFHPNTTPSNTGLDNIHTLLNKYMALNSGRDLGMIGSYDVNCVTRAYQTRHGNGFMTNLNKGNNIKENPYEINQTNQFQGNFKRSILDLDLYNYGLQRHGINTHRNFNLFITNLDQVEDAWSFTLNGKIHHFNDERDFIIGIVDGLNMTNPGYEFGNRVFLSHSPVSDNIVSLKEWKR